MLPQFCQSLLNPLACAIESELNAIYNVPGYKRQDGLLKHPAVFSDKKPLESHLRPVGTPVLLSYIVVRSHSDRPPMCLSSN